jgi:hypothetical protein
MNLYRLDGTPVPTMNHAELQELFETVELRLLTAMRDDPPAVPSLQLQNNLLWSLLNPEMFEE